MTPKHEQILENYNQFKVSFDDALKVYNKNVLWMFTFNSFLKPLDSLRMFRKVFSVRRQSKNLQDLNSRYQKELLPSLKSLTKMDDKQEQIIYPTLASNEPVYQPTKSISVSVYLVRMFPDFDYRSILDLFDQEVRETKKMINWPVLISFLGLLVTTLVAFNVKPETWTTWVQNNISKEVLPIIYLPLIYIAFIALVSFRLKYVEFKKHLFQRRCIKTCMALSGQNVENTDAYIQ